MIVTWLLWTLVVFAPNGEYNGAEDGRQYGLTRLQCEQKLPIILERKKLGYPKAAFIYGLCIPELEPDPFK